MNRHGQPHDHVDDRPETAALRVTEREVARANRHIYYAIIAGLCIVLAIVLSYAIVTTQRFDHANGQIEATNNQVNAIRETQQHNTKVTQCQLRAFDQVLTELFKIEPITPPPTC